MSFLGLLGAGTSLLGGLLGSKANERAAETAAAAQLEAARLGIAASKEAQEKQLAFAREGQDYLKGYRAEQVPGETYLRRAVAEEGELTPAQRAQLDELRRKVGNQISTSSIAGSGRTAAALLRKVEADYTNDALDRNRNRSYDAASGMAQRSGNAATGIGNISVGTGNQQANLIMQGGAYGAQGTANAGNVRAQADAANANMWNQTMGNVGGIIAREGRYGTNFGSPSSFVSDNKW